MAQYTKKKRPGGQNHFPPLSLKNTMRIIPLACGFDNFAYLLICETTRSAAVVDPTEPYPVWREVERAGVELRAVLCTHHHRDHVDGLEELLVEQPDLDVYGFHSDAARIAGLNRPLADGAVFQLGRLPVRVLHTPGHTTGSVCYQVGTALFTGDTLFGAGCGRLFEGTAATMFHSLTRKIAVLAPGTELYFGHDYTRQNLLFARMLEPENMAIERRLQDLAGPRNGSEQGVTLWLESLTNPFLRCHEPSIRKNFIMIGGAVRDEEIFALVRQRRDGFSVS